MWRRGVVANVREEAGRFRHWLVWAGAEESEEVDLRTVQWRWADAAQPVARERSGNGAFRQPRRRRGGGSGLQERCGWRGHVAWGLTTSCPRYVRRWLGDWWRQRDLQSEAREWRVQQRG
eukprot:4449757-Prymnesium_polylepis.1